jgi:uncharacterized membrane protein YeaQ/YmgE (transglycosylase-associated protein family)
MVEYRERQTSLKERRRVMLTNLIIWILLGALAGWIASMITGRDAQMGAGANIVVGIIGALIGGFIMNSLGGPGVSGLNLYSVLVAIGGAVVLLFLVGLFRRA